MYKELGRFGFINLRSITFHEDRMEDMMCDYKYGFDLELLPCIKLYNHESRQGIKLRWLNWELVCFRFKVKKQKDGRSKD